MLDMTPATMVLASLPFGIVLLDRERRVCFMNPIATLLLSIDVDRHIGAAASEFCLATGLPADLFTACPTRLHCGHGFTAQAMPLAQEAVRAGISAGLILTARADARPLSDEHIDALSHDLRTPITIIQGFSELLLRDLESPLEAQQRELVQAIRDWSRSMAQTVNRAMARCSDSDQRG